jgi:hypothetical protein
MAWATEAFPRWAAAALVDVGGRELRAEFRVKPLDLTTGQGFATPMCEIAGLIE